MKCHRVLGARAIVTALRIGLVGAAAVAGGSFTSAQILWNSNPFFVSPVIDLDGDGVVTPIIERPELCVSSRSDNHNLTVTIADGKLVISNETDSVAFSLGAGMPTSLQIDDFDGDGDEDVIFSTNESMLVAINNGGTILSFLGPIVTIPDVGSNFISMKNIVAADLNGDTGLDVIAAVADLQVPPAPSTVELRGFLQNPGGGGTYGSPVVLPLPDVPGGVGAVAVGNLDAGSAPEVGAAVSGGVLIARFEGGSFSLVSAATGASLPPGSPASQAIVPFANDAREIVFADVNNDGFKDIVVTDYTNVRIRAGNGDGTFSPSALTLTGESSLMSLAVGDLNGDNMGDICAVNFNNDECHVWLSTGPLVYGPRTDYDAGHDAVSIVIGDETKDGKPDLQVLHRADGTIMLGINKGDGTFGFPQRLGDQFTIQDVAVGDFDGDGYTDAVGGCGSANVFLHFNLGDGSGRLLPAQNPSGDRLVNSTQIVTLPGPGAVAGDGRDRFVIAFSDTFAWLEYVPTAVLGRRAVARGTLATGFTLNGMTTCDLNNDGWSDLAVVFPGANPCARIYQQDTSGGFTIPPINLVTTSAGAAGEFDQILVTGPGSGLPQNWVFLFDQQTGRTEVQEYSAGLFTFKAEFQSGAPGAGAALGDIDGDGQEDLIVVNADPGTGVRRVTVQTHLESASPPPPSFFPLPRFPTNVATGDIDGDGDSDVIVCTAGPVGQTQHVLVIPNTDSALDVDNLAFHAVGGQPRSIVLADLHNSLRGNSSGTPLPEILSADSDPPNVFYNGSITVLENIATLAQPPACPGDASGDSAVGLADIALMIQHWSLTHPPVPPYTMGDLTGDGLVTLADVAIVIQHWGQSCRSAR